jgi:hypothetical protein
MSTSLKALLVQLQNEEIEAVEFGEPGKPMGVMSSHRIMFFPTAGGIQFCIKQVTSRGLGSGMYLGLNLDVVVAASTKQVEHYMRPHPNALIRKFIAQKGDRTKLEYFAVPKSA